MSRKYIRDFRLEEDIDERGHVKKKTVYIGGEYIFLYPEAAGPKARLRVAVLTALCWPLFIIPLVPVSQAGKLIYAALPFACAVIPIALLSAGAYSLLRAGSSLRREQSVQFSRMPVFAFLIIMLSGAAALSVFFTALLFWKNMPFSDALFLFCSAALCALGAALLRYCRRLKVMKRENVT